MAEKQKKREGSQQNEKNEQKCLNQQDSHMKAEEEEILEVKNNKCNQIDSILKDSNDENKQDEGNGQKKKKNKNKKKQQKSYQTTSIEKEQSNDEENREQVDQSNGEDDNSRLVKNIEQLKIDSKQSFQNKPNENNFKNKNWKPKNKFGSENQNVTYVYKEKKNKNENNNSETNQEKEDAIMQDSSLESSSANQNNLEQQKDNQNLDNAQNNDQKKAFENNKKAVKNEVQKQQTLNKSDDDWVEEESSFNVDAIIEKLLAVKSKMPGSMVTLDLKTEIMELIQRTTKIINEQPMLLRLKAPLVVGTDIHGQYYDLLRFMNETGFPPQTNYLFLGDYVDRGRQSIETLCLLFAFKIKYPECVFLLRGNHECENISKIYGFYEECRNRYSIKLWREFINVFNILPVTALIEDKILCMHGGISPDLKNLQQINKIPRPTVVPENGLLCDLLWADPATGLSQLNHQVKAKGWGPNDRGTSFVFSEKTVKKFIEDHDLDLIVRGHQIMEDGYEFFADQRLVTIFSAPNYCNEFDNDGAMLIIKQNLLCSFQKLLPAEKIARNNIQRKKGFNNRPGTPTQGKYR